MYSASSLRQTSNQRLVCAGANTEGVYPRLLGVVLHQGNCSICVAYASIR